METKSAEKVLDSLGSSLRVVLLGGTTQEIAIMWWIDYRHLGHL